MAKKKIVLFGHQQIFQALTATGFREDGEPVNGIYFSCGQPKE
jgi:hypothetical protein